MEDNDSIPVGARIPRYLNNRIDERVGDRKARSKTEVIVEALQYYFDYLDNKETLEDRITNLEKKYSEFLDRLDQQETKFREVKDHIDSVLKRFDQLNSQDQLT